MRLTLSSFFIIPFLPPQTGLEQNRNQATHFECESLNMILSNRVGILQTQGLQILKSPHSPSQSNIGTLMELYEPSLNKLFSNSYYHLGI